MALTARVIERALGAEMDDLLGRVKADPAGNRAGNSRHGSSGKRITTTVGTGADFGSDGPKVQVRVADRGERGAAHRGR